MDLPTQKPALDKAYPKLGVGEKEMKGIRSACHVRFSRQRGNAQRLCPQTFAFLKLWLRFPLLVVQAMQQSRGKYICT